jgi:hypothetical protein
MYNDDIDRIPRMSMEMLLLELQYARQEWWLDLINREILRRQNSRTDKSVAIVLKKSA